MAENKKILIAGGAGFVGASLCRRYLNDGWEVVCVDNLSTGRRENIKELENNPKFIFIEHDICENFPSSIVEKNYDVVANLASPASPPQYVRLAKETLLVGVLGTKNLLDLSLNNNSRFFQASTSEVYGDPEVHPQVETYKGSVNCYGPRSMYDESKRAAEALIYIYKNQMGADTCIARFFNTYGPYMDPEDGRVVSNFIVQALKGEKLTIYGEGSQTRSFCYIDDLVEGIVRLIASKESQPMNLGNPGEFTILELAEKIIEKLKVENALEYLPLPGDDPMQRKPEISYAVKALGWEPKIVLEDGLDKTIAYFKTVI
jgi:UDP-glucuronate decarboxylase